MWECACGIENNDVQRKCNGCGWTKEQSDKYKEESKNPVVLDPDIEIRCPHCGSNQISVNKKGFGLGKAVGGALLLGPLGLMGGFVGQNKMLFSCLKCAGTWRLVKNVNGVSIQK